MNKASIIIVVSVLLTPILAYSRGDDGEPAENSTGDETATDLEETLLEEMEEIDIALIDPWGGERTDLYASNWDAIGSLVVAGGADIPDDLFGGYKRLNVYLLDSSPDKVFIELGDPYFSPYIGTVQITAVTVFGVYSDGTEELLSNTTLAPGVEGGWHETVLLTYEFDKPEGFLDTPATRMILDMTYDLEEYGTGEMRADIWIEP